MKAKKSLGYAKLACAVSAAAFAQSALGGATTQPSSGSPVYNAPVPGNSNGGDYATISISGSTAMRNFTTAAGFSYLPAGTDIFLSSGSFFNTTSSVGYQLEPNNAAANSSSTAVEDVPAVRAEWHEQGSVEGELELVNDEIGTPAVVPPSLIGRSPSPTNPLWINRNTFGGATTANGWTSGTFNNTPPPAYEQQNPVQFAIADVKPVQSFAVSGTPSYSAQPNQPGYGLGNPALIAPPSSNISGLGLAGGREEFVPQDDLNMPTTANDPATGQPYASGPWNSAGLNNLQTNTVAVTATTFSANPGVGLTGVNKTDAQWLQTTGRLKNGATFQMSTRDVGSGTRNTAANNTGVDPSWAVGVNDDGNLLASDAPTTIAADNQDAIGHTTLAIISAGTDGSSFTSIPTIRFSGKTSGGLLGVAVANSRMSIGTLGLPDVLKRNGLAGTGNGAAAPLSILSLDATPGDHNPNNYVYPTAANIINGSYIIWQQEQYVTVKDPNPAFATATAEQWAAASTFQIGTQTTALTGIKGDTANNSVPLSGNVASGSNLITGGNVPGGGFLPGQVVTSDAFPAGTTVTGVTYNSDGSIASLSVSNPATTTGSTSFTVSGGDVANFLNNILSSVPIAGGTIHYNAVTDPGDQLVATQFILPAFMQVKKAYDGGPVTDNGYTNTLAAFNINTNPTGYSATLSQEFLGSTVAAQFSPLEVTTGHLITTPLSASASGGYYGEAVRGATNDVGGTISAQPNVAFTNGNVGITSSNYLFGNFNNNGVRDYSAFKTSVAALTALYNSGDGVDVYDQTAVNGTSGLDSLAVGDSFLDAAMPGLSGKLGSTSTFIGQRGPASGGITGVGVAPATAIGVSKGDLIVMGDYNGDGRFDGRDIYLMAIGTTLSENYSTDTLNNNQDITTGVLNKNGALDYVQAATAEATYDASGNASDASGFIRQSGRAMLSGSSVPSGAVELATGTDATGAAVDYYTFDPLGANAFNKSDVNRDGQVDFNDATIVDNFNGQSYTNLNDQLSATIPAPVTGSTEPISLVLVQQIDNESAIGAADLAVVNGELTGTANANWYDYNVQKTGPGAITWARTGGTVTVYYGASFEISSGTVEVVGGAINPFADNNASGPTVGNQLGVTVDGTGVLKYSGNATINQVPTVSGNGQIDIVGNALTVDYGTGADPAATIRGYLVGGFNAAGTKWTGSGIVSDLAAANPTTKAIGYADGGNAKDVANTDGLVSPGEVEIEYTVAGDANLSGSVDLSDLVIIASDFGQSGVDWAEGDLNYDGNVDLSDLVIVASNFGASLSSTSSADFGSSFAAEWKLALAEAHGSDVLVPEPGTVGLAAAGAAGLLARRRRRR